MWLWTRQEAKQIDELSLQSGIAAETLMETAGQNSAAQIFGLAPLARSVFVLCGPGNNGGDGFVVARELLRLGLEVQVVELSGNSELRAKKKSEFQGKILTADEFLRQTRRADLWIDALFGIGLNRPLNGLAFSLIEKANQSAGLKISLDTPSGLEVDTGNIQGIGFESHWTLTVGAPKPGFYFNEGPRLCGKIRKVDSGFPAEISKKIGRSVFLLTSYQVQKWLPSRQPTDHKSHGGRTLIWGGSPEMPGAAVLACEAAARVGSGYVYSAEREVLRFRPEVIPWKLGDFSNISSCVLGPGLGTGSDTLAALKKLSKIPIPSVIDADALTVAAKEKFGPFAKNWIATPHAGELSRLIEISSQEIERDRLKACRQGQKKWAGIFLLKGFHTVVTYPQFSVIVPTGNVALAKGGSGDVLAGMIAGFLSQGISVEKAPLVACFIHGWIADRWIKNKKDFLSLTAQDLLLEIPRALHYFRNLNFQVK